MTHLTRLLTLSVLASLLAFSALNGQERDKASKKLIRKADKEFRQRNFVEAVELYKQAVDPEFNDFELAYRIGRCYFNMRDPQSELDWYTTAVEMDPDGSDTIYFDLGSVLMKLEQYSEAKVQFNTFLSRYEEDDEYLKQAQVRIEGCDFAMSQKNVDPDYAAKEVDGINAGGTDFNPSPYIMKGDSFFIFTSHRSGNRGKKEYQRLGEPFSDLWIAEMTSDSTFTGIENMGKKVNTKANDGSAIVSPDGLTMYYTICGQGKIGKKYGCSIYMSEFNPDAKEWGKYQVVEGLVGQREVVVNSRGKTKTVPTYDSNPSLSADGNTMYFVSDRDGGQGSHDIWYSQKRGNAWSAPVNLGPTINTPFEENTPIIGEDGETLYFASNGRAGFGGTDIFRAKGQGNAWEEPENMGKGLNSSYDEHGLVWLYQDSLGYISSNRADGTGKYDIYRVRYIYRPPLDISVQGTIRDKETKEAVAFATVILYELDAERNLIPVDTFQTDQTAKYEFQLEENKEYKIVGNAPEYLAGEEFVSTMEFEDKTDEAELKDGKFQFDLERDIDIYLEAINLDQPIVLENVYFDFDSSNIRSDARPVLEQSRSDYAG